MLTLTDHFNDLLKTIEPKGDRKDKAGDLPAQVRNFLKKCSDIETIEPHSRLAGSYARSTAVKAIKDVDILLLIALKYRYELSTEDVLELVFQALHGLPEALDDKGEVIQRRHQRRSINVHLEKSDFDLDIVPAIAVNGIDQPLLIPDKDWNSWVDTHPLGYADKLSELNQANDKMVVPLVKMFKHWRDVQMTYLRPKSYWLEVLVYQLISDGIVTTKDKSHAELFHDLLKAVCDKFAGYLSIATLVPPITDPMLGHNIAHQWEWNAFETFMRRVDESITWSAKALNLDEEHRSDAVELWQKVFGAEWFPTKAAAEKGAEMLKALSAGGAVSVAPSGRVHVQKPGPGDIPAPPQRFYGDE